MPTLVLVAPAYYDSFIYDTQQLSVVRAGSELARKFPDWLVGKLSSELGELTFKPLSLGGSSLVMELNSPGDEEAVKMCINTVVADHEFYRYFPLIVVSDTYKQFDGCVARLNAKGNWQRTQLLGVSPPSLQQTGSSVRSPVCQLTKVLVANAHDGPRNEDLNQFTYSRLQYGRGMSMEGSDLGLARSFSDIAEVRDTNGEVIHTDKLAFIYFDGNEFGERVRQSTNNRNAYSKFDESIRKQREKVRSKFLTEIEKSAGRLSGLINHDSSGNRILAFSYLLWGGDDSLIVVPARSAIDVMRFLATRTKAIKPKLEYAFGILICDQKTPVREAKRMAESLSNLSKLRTRDSTTWSIAVLESLDFIPFSDSTSAVARYFERRYRQQTLFSDFLHGFNVEKQNDYNDRRLEQLLAPITKVSRGQLRRVAQVAANSSHSDSGALAFDKRLLEMLDRDVSAKVQNSVQELGLLWLPKAFHERIETTDLAKDDRAGFSRLPVWIMLEELYDYLPALNQGSTSKQIGQVA